MDRARCKWNHAGMDPATALKDTRSRPILIPSRSQSITGFYVVETQGSYRVGSPRVVSVNSGELLVIEIVCLTKKGMLEQHVKYATTAVQIVSDRINIRTTDVRCIAFMR